MSVRAAVSVLRGSLEQMTLHAAAGASALWLGVVVREWPRLTAFGAICGEARGLLGHCPLCLPTAALTGVALIGAVALARRRPV